MARARAEIVLRLSDEQLEHVQGLRDPAEMWRTLRDVHRSRGFATEVRKWREQWKMNQEYL